MSLVAHAVLIATIVLLPENWRTVTVKPEATPMMITLGGAPGPAAGGMTTIADRAVQAVAEPAAKPKVEPPPAPKAPEMVAPEPNAKVAPKTPVEARRRSPRTSPTSKKPTTGTEIKSGVVEREDRRRGGTVRRIDDGRRGHRRRDR